MPVLNTTHHPENRETTVLLRPEDLHRPSLAGLVAFVAIYFNCCFVAKEQIMPRYKNNNICQACHLVESNQLMAGVPRWSTVAPVPACVPVGCGKYSLAQPRCLAWDCHGLLSADPYPAPSYDIFRRNLVTG